MTSSERRPKPLSAVELRKIVLEALVRGTFKESFHFRFDHPERKISVRDVVHGLQQEWRACEPEEFNESHWQWKYRVKTFDLDDRRLTVVIAVDPRNKWFEIVTKFHD